jgi:predicted permease
VDARTFVPPMMFNNCGNMGLPLAYLSFGERGLAMMVVLFVTSNFIMFTLGMRLVRGSVRWREALANPMVVATVAGTLCGAAQVTFPGWLTPALKMVADVSIPLMLFSLGARMRDLSFRDWHLPVLGAIVCPVSGLLIAPFLIRPLALSDMQGDVLLLFAALPPAVLNFLLAERYKREPQQVASIVLIGNLASIVFVPFALAWALHG